MNKIIIYYLLVCALPVSTLLAQNQGYMQTISIPDGLSSPNVMSVYQDRFGYIWIMTEDGLNRYDGSTIKIYRNDPDDPNSLFSNSVYSAVEDMDGYLWIGGIGFASRYDYATETFEGFNFNSLPSGEKDKKVISLFTDSKGRIWGGTSGGSIHKLDNELGTFEIVNYGGNIEAYYTGEIWSITELKNGKILYANRTQGIFQYDEPSKKLSKFLLDNNYSPVKIFRIQEDDDGTIWFSGEDRIIRYNPNFYSYEILDEFQVQSKMYHTGYHKVSNENYIFIAEPFSLIRYNPKTSEVIETIKTELNPYWFISDKFGIVWIAAQGGLIKYDPNNEPFSHVKINVAENQDNRGSVINYIKPDKLDKQSIWMLSTGNMLVKYNLKNSSTRLVKIKNPGSQLQFDRFIQDSQGDFLLGSSSSEGIFKYDIKSQKLTRFNEIPASFSGRFRLRDFAFDQNNNLFTASTFGLIYYNFKDNTQFILPTIANRRYSSQTEETIQKALINAKKLALITQANESKSYSIDFSLKEDSYIFIHCLGEGQLDDRSGDLIWDYGILRKSLDDIIFEMQDYHKTFHAGGGYKNRMQYKTIRLKKGEYNLTYDMDSGHSYNDFNAPAPDDSTNYGIQLYKITEESYKKIDRLIAIDLNKTLKAPLEFLTDIEVSRKFSNSIYLSSDTQGLFRYNILDSSLIQYTFGELQSSNQKNWLQNSFEDIAGNLWISTAQGLVWLNPDNGKWRVFTEKDGLPSNNILNTIEDNNGDLWIISLGGLSRFNKNDSAEKWNFVNYDTRDGLTGYSFNGNPLKTPQGEILFSVADDLHRFTPRKPNSVKPDIVINDFKISDQSIFNSDSPLKLKKSLMETKEISLPFNLNDLSFNFNIVHYSRPYKNRLFYKMEGFNEKWIESELGTATFTNLEPGSYDFKVRGISADGIRNDEGASIKIEIFPPWWKTTFAYIGYFLFFALLIFTIDRIQRRRVLTKERAATAIKEAELRAKLAESENERKTKELEEARQLQLSMLPKELPQLPNLDIAVYMQTATEVGGDYYDFHVGLDGTLTVVIGDATGHGMKAGTMVTAAKSLFSSYAPNPDILFSFSEITRCIKQMNFGKLSMCLTMLKIKGGKMQISTAGMPPSFIFRQDTKVVEEHLFKAMPLGTMLKFPYEVKDTTLKTGDTILLMSDGLPEFQNENEEMYGYKRIRNGFEDVAEKQPEEIITFLKNEGKAWNGNQAPDDDVTFVVIKVK
jgi:serine phosphatase RsbU (regulator of sigma subunit)/ligand-binding sensor domain-containing protein